MTYEIQRYLKILKNYNYIDSYVFFGAFFLYSNLKKNCNYVYKFILKFKT